jgi:hypothetical protein
MAIPVKRKVRVIEATYSKEADSIVMIGECSEGRLRHQIHSSCFNFGGLDKEIEMTKTASMMIGKPLMMVFDPDLMDKIKDGVPIKYR